ncbi:glycosyltransferase family A protein [Butyrivibrio sp. INlla16]|uniref:glycosyltransferase family 2 protein n=1 Tax=Butyrivibrio sp. INlla16 TaxID=1520807 RepID=UPI00087FC8D6|nr:glycosyltransferase family A protein [Butyrivibrio sp. INlla16]SDB47875.1 Glycosyl transferase family 2 [Butyrivibrio sp. INlla16]
MSTNGGGPLISVIIPAYNAQELIENCVKSVCNQVVSDTVRAFFGIANDADSSLFEVVIVDDGSTDKTGEICDRLSSEYNFIKTIHVKNGGVSKARNIGLENSCGRYIAFVDADDSVEDTYFDNLLVAVTGGDDTASEDRISLVIMDGKMVTDDIITGRRYLEDGLLCEDTHVWGKLFSREALTVGGREIRFPEGLTIGEDMLFLMEFLIGIGDRPGIRAIEGGGYHYNYNDDGAMLKRFTPSYLDQITCWERADKLMESMNPGVSLESVRRLSVIKIMAALLVVGKFAKILNMSENSDRAMILAMREEVIGRAKGMITAAKAVPGAFRALSSGYKVKTVLFSVSPDLYMKLYGQWKKR